MNGGADGTTPFNMTLSPVDRQALTAAGRHLRRYDLVSRTEEFVLEAQVQAGALSARLRRSLLAFRRFGHPSGAILIRGVPIGTIPPTPERADMEIGVTLTGAATMSVLLACLGDQYGFRPELGGNIVQDILPVHGFEAEQISVGSTVDLEPHTETAFSPFRSDYVGLLCLRQDHDRQAGTTLSSIDEMLPLLDPAAQRTLQQPRFRTKVDVSFLLNSDLKDVWVDPIRVLEGSPRRPRMCVDFAGTEGKDPLAQEALEALRAAAASTQVVAHLAAGDLLVVDNNRAVHGRAPFTPRYDGGDRWLLRSFVTRDLSRSEIARADGRIVADVYDAEAHRVA